MHALHAITRPPELQYGDLLATISSLARSLTENAWASSHAEQRDMHTSLDAQAHGQKRIETKLNELTTHVLEVKTSVIAKQAIKASASIEFSQKLSEAQLGQFLRHMSVDNLPEPSQAFEASILMAKKRQARASKRRVPFWLDAKVQKWNNSRESSLIMVNGTRKGQFHFQHFCARSVEILQDSKLPVIWGLKTLASGKTRADQVSASDLLKYLILQAIKINENIQTDAALSLRFRAYLEAQNEEDWMNILASVLQGIPLLYIVIDIELISDSSGTLAKDFWPSAFRGMFAKLSERNIRTVVRVVLVSYGSSLLRGPFSKEYQDLVVTVGGTRQGRRSTGVLPYRKQIAPTARQEKYFNLGAIAEGHRVRGRVSRPSQRARRGR